MNVAPLDTSISVAEQSGIIYMALPFSEARDKVVVARSHRLFETWYDRWCISSDAVERSELCTESREKLKLLFRQRVVNAHRYIVGTGGRMMDQFQPWYCGVAFDFIFKFCTGMPDMPAWGNNP